MLCRPKVWAAVMAATFGHVLSLAVLYVLTTNTFYRQVSSNTFYRQASSDVTSSVSLASDFALLQTSKFPKAQRLLQQVSPRRKKYLPSRTRYYSNSDASYQTQRICISGDVSTNPGPNNTGKTSMDKCPVCLRTIAKNHRAITCGSWGSRFHLKCGGVPGREYNQLLSRDSKTWLCTRCLFNELPFHTTLHFDPRFQGTADYDWGTERTKWSTKSTTPIFHRD